MDIRQLRYFVAVYKHRNISHAAEHCSVAQSAISHHITNLEEESGTSLFVRKPRGMEPTAAGERLFKHANGILGAIDHALNDLKKSNAEISGDIAIGMPFSVIKTIGTEMMTTILSDYPNVRLLLSEGFSGIVYQNLLASDMAFALVYNPPADNRIIMEPILREELFCIGRESIVGADDGPLTFEAFSGLPVILFPSGTLTRALVERPGLRSKLEGRSSLQIASVAGTVAALKAGLGCTLAPKVLVREMLESGELIARPIVDPAPLRTLFIVSKPDDRPTYLRELMIDLVKRLSRGAVAEGRWPEATWLD